MKNKVLSILKPKVASLGFNEDELMSVAEHVATAVQSDAEDEDINAHIEAVIPYLQLAQRQASRVISKTKPKQEQSETAGDELKNLIAEIGQLKNELFEVKQGAIKNTRRAEIEGLVKDRGVFGKQILSSYDRMKFESEDNYVSFVEEIKNTLKEFDTELASAGLSNITALGGKPKEPTTVQEIMSDEEVDNLAKTF